MKNNLILIYILWMCMPLFGQLGDTFNVQTYRQRALKDFESLPEKVRIIDTSIEVPAFKYNYKEQLFYQDYTPDTLKPAKLKVKEPLSPIYRIYTKAGVGSSVSPLFDLHYNSPRAKDYSYGLRYHHLSSHLSPQLKHLGIKDNPASRQYAENDASLFYNRHWRKYSLFSDLYYEREGYHFYNFENNRDFGIESPKTIKQHYDVLGTNLRLKSFLEDSNAVNFDAELHYHFLQERTKSNEHYIKADYLVDGFIRNNYLSLQGFVDYHSFQPGLDELNRIQSLQINGANNSNAIVDIQPMYYLKQKHFNLKAGFELALDFNQKTQASFFPEVELKFPLFNNVFIPYAGITGAIDRNNLRTTLDQNPFILPYSSFKNSRTPYDFYGGIRGSISKKITFNAQARYSQTKQFMFFLPDTTNVPGYAYNYYYDTIQRVSLHASFSYQLKEKWKTSLSATYTMFTVDGKDSSRYAYYGTNFDLGQAWFMPTLEITLKNHYNIGDAILLNVDLFFVGARKALTADYFEDGSFQSFTERTLKPYVDANIQVEYRITKRFSVWALLNNIASQNYVNYWRAQRQGFQFFAGATYRFLR